VSAFEVQSFLARLYVDDPFRRLFELEPEPLLAQYRLTGPERGELLALDRDAVDRFARGLKRKRMGRLMKAFPLWCGHLDRKLLRHYADRFYELHPDDATQSPREQIGRLGRFLAESLADDPDAPPFAAELVVYERLLFTAALLAAPAGPNPAPPAAVSPADFIAPRAGVGWESFRWDVARIAAQLKRGEKTQAGAPGSFALLFRPRSPRVLRATPDTLQLVELASAGRAASDIAARYSRQVGEEGLEVEVLEALSDLCRQEILEIRGAAGQPPEADEELLGAAGESWEALAPE
jgi:hypothetical protein